MKPPTVAEKWNTPKLWWLIAGLSVGFIYGAVFIRHQVFPHSWVKRILYGNEVDSTKTGPWSIGIYEGNSPFNLQPASSAKNPVISAKDVSDIDAVFAADPFFIQSNHQFFLFFEALNRSTNAGDIAYAESQDGYHWKYKKVVIDEPFHLSFPYVFEWQGVYYMIPESNRDYSLRLYRATNFPDKWELDTILLSGYKFVDPAIVRHQNRWWLFLSSVDDDILNIYFSDSLHQGWRPHPLNPVVKFNRHIARPGGRIFQYDGKLYRMAQDDEPEYGLQVFAVEILELTDSTYKEQPIMDKPIVAGSGRGWNKAGMHHVDLLPVGNKWIAVTDGRVE